MLIVKQFGKACVGIRTITTLKENPDAAHWFFGIEFSADRVARFGVVIDIYKIQFCFWWYR